MWLRVFSFFGRGWFACRRYNSIGSPGADVLMCWKGILSDQQLDSERALAFSVSGGVGGPGYHLEPCELYQHSVASPSLTE